MTVTAEECCWGLVESSTTTEKLLEVVPLHTLDTSTVPEHDVEVIPMQEELEVRLEQSSFPVPSEWSFKLVEAALHSDATSVNVPVPQEFNQVKLELEVTLTPEIVSHDSLTTSTVSLVTTNRCMV